MKESINNETAKRIREFCIKRDYKCKGCPYNIRKVYKEAPQTWECIFGNCPASWSWSE